MFQSHRTRRLRSWLAVAVAAVFCSAALSSSALAAPKPTVVLVHGAFADASGWNAVANRLQDQGYPVLAPSNPLRGVSADSAYLKNVLAQIEGPIVLVGHSYGGMVITNAATGNPNVKALVYIAAYAPDEGDSVASLGALGKGGTVGPSTLTIRTFPAADGSLQPEGYIKLSVFRKIFCADLSPKVSSAMAVAQRPAALTALGEPSGAPAWKTIPSWYMVAGKDHTIGTDTERAMAKRISPRRTVEIKNASHAVMVSRPAATASLITAAATATQ